MTKITIYSDGAASPNPGYGGWGCVILTSKRRKELSGSKRDATNNQMEMTAALRALQALTKPCEVTLYTDSRYLCDAFKKNWFKNWRRNGWKTSKGSPVLNQDLWGELLVENERHNIDWQWVRGHSDNVENNCCDELAVNARIALHLKDNPKKKAKSKPRKAKSKTKVNKAAEAVLKMNLRMEELNDKQKKDAFKLFNVYWEDELRSSGS